MFYGHFISYINTFKNSLSGSNLLINLICETFASSLPPFLPFSLLAFLNFTFLPSNIYQLDHMMSTALWLAMWRLKTTTTKKPPWVLPSVISTQWGRSNPYVNNHKKLKCPGVWGNFLELPAHQNIQGAIWSSIEISTHLQQPLNGDIFFHQEALAGGSEESLG